MNGWGLAWIIVGCLAYLLVGWAFTMVMWMDSGGPENVVLRVLARLGIMVGWLPGMILMMLIGGLLA